METQAISTLARPAAVKQQRAGSRSLRRLLGTRSAFELHAADSASRPELEAYIARCFERAYGATVAEFAPQLLELSCAGNISGVAGVRPASHSRLFLEQYIDESVEDLAAREIGAVERHEIVELCNLAAFRPGACQLINIMLAPVLYGAGFRYAGLVSTAKLEGIIRKQGFSVRAVTRADPVRLGAAAADWGSYYDTAPNILFVDLERTMAALRGQRLAAAFLIHYRAQIRCLSDRLAGLCSASSKTGVSS
jgi:hypothetical protein